ncbi:hypothetical protein [Enterococcus olivae]
MEIMTRLDQLTEEVRQSFSEDFIFLIYPDKVQHYPARNWNKADYFDSLEERLGTDYSFTEWENKVVAIAKDESVAAVVPRFQRITTLFESE